MANEKLFHVGIKALIENEQGLILLLKAPAWERGNIEAHWDIPGGRIQEGQNATEVLAREVEEETGIRKIESFDFFTAVVSNHQIPFEDKMLGLVLMIYKVRIPKNSQIKISDEHVAHEWVSAKEAAKRLAQKYPPEFTTLLSK